MIQEYFQSLLFESSALPPAANISRLGAQTILGVSTVFLLILTLWLSLYGHRKVSGYFAKKEIYLPFVLSWARVEFYYSLWLLKLLRSAFFVLAALPAMFLVYVSAVPEERLHEFMKSGIHFVLWISAIVSAVGALAVVSSAADAEHRASESVWYRVLPMICLISGTGTWIYTLFTTIEAGGALRSLLSVLPIFGLNASMQLSIVRLGPSVLALHTMLSLLLMLLALNLYFFSSSISQQENEER